jgi:hypothetical protein
MATYRGPGGAGDATNDASNQAVLAQQYAQQAEVSKNQAAASATSAAASASSATTSATNAANSASSASSAGASATAAANSATAAATSATSASNSATAASASATAAAASESTVAASASSASTSASNAATSATNASNSASAAATSATNAANSATAAATSASNASTSATNASNSASSASTSATNASNSATSASSSASTATTQAGIATTQATNAATSATAASGSASSAATSATNAATAQTAAESARDATLAAYDSFDDRYLGAKSSAPTLDNDGNALIGGALYFDTVSQGMKLYTGSVWVDAYVPGTDYLAKVNNLSDLQSASTARTNLGLGTAATTNSTAYATAAQGAKADTALQSFTETDPVYVASSWYSTTNNSSNWNTAFGWGNHASAGYAADNAVVKLTGNQTVGGTKTFSSTITGSITGNAGTVTNGVVTTGSYADPSWITSLAGSKITGTIDGGSF